MKKPKLAVTVLGAGLVIALSSTLSAQARGTFRASPEPANSQRAVETPKKQPVVVVVPPSTVFSPQPFYRQPVVFFNIPAILMSDGTVLADFGMGYEQVSRACGNTVVVQNEPRIIAGNGVVLSQGSSTITTQQTVTSSSRYPILTSVSQTSCYSRDAYGRVFVVRQ